MATSSWLEALKALLGDGSLSVPVHDWTGIEEFMRTRLPSDYESIVDKYGAGSFDEFLGILTPDADTPYLDLVRRGDIDRDALRQLTAQGVSLPDQIREINQLLTWGITDNGDLCYWLREGDPDKWRIAINDSRGSTWDFFDMGIAEFLYKCLSRQITVTVFPEDFPDPSPKFWPNL